MPGSNIPRVYNSRISERKALVRQRQCNLATNQSHVPVNFRGGNPFSNFGTGGGFPGGVDIGDIFSQFVGGRNQQQTNEFESARARKGTNR